MDARRYLAPIGVASLLLAGPAACGGSDTSSTAGGTPTSGAAATPAGSEVQANGLTLTARGTDFAISGSPRPGHIDVTFANTDSKAHEAQIVPLKPGKSVQDVLADLKSGGEQKAAADLAADPETTTYGTPALLSGGQTSEVISDRIPAGTYAVVSFLPGADGQPQVTAGMAGQFTVGGAPVEATPARDGEVSLTDSGITLPAGFQGRGTFAVTNAGTKQHSFSIARLDGPLDDLFNYVGSHLAQNQPIDGAPGAIVSGVATLNPGQTAFLVLDLEPGHYGYVSTVQGDGGPSDTDYARGLKGEFTVN